MLRSQSVPLSQLKLAQGSSASAASSPSIASSSSGSNSDVTVIHHSAAEENRSPSSLPHSSSRPEGGSERGLGGSLATSATSVDAPATTAIRAADLARAAAVASQELSTAAAAASASSSSDASSLVDDAISLEMNHKMAIFVTHKDDICALLKAMKHSRELEQQHLKGVKKLWRELKTQKNDVFSAVNGWGGPVGHVVHGVPLHPTTGAVIAGGQGQTNTINR